MAEATGPRFDIQRIYIKDLSVECPEAPKIFREQWQPETHVDLNVAHVQLEDSNYEVVLRVTVTMKREGKTVLVIEVNQCAIFSIVGFDADQLDHMLRAYCPNVLFPYAREAVSDMSTRTTFPPVNLSPINFDAIYMQQKQQEKETVKQ